MLFLLKNGLKPIVIFDGLLNEMKTRHLDVKTNKISKKLSDELVTKIKNVS